MDPFWESYTGVARMQAADALAAKNRVELETERRALDTQKTIAADLAPKPGETPLTLGQMLDRGAAIALSRGDFNAAVQMREGSARATLQDAQTSEAQGRAEEAHYKAAGADLTMQGQLFGATTSQAELDSANRLYEKMSGRRSPFAGQVWSPEFAANVTEHTLTQSQRLKEAHDKARDVREAKKADGYLSYTSGMVDAAKMRAKAMQTRADAVAAGKAVKPITMPSTQELADTMQAIKTVYPDLPADQKGPAAMLIASKAKALMKANPALDPHSAISQAITANARYFEHQGGMFGFGGRSVFKGGGGSTPQEALPAPEDMSKAAPNRWYINKRGQIGFFDGTSVKLYAPGSAGAGGEVTESPEDQIPPTLAVPPADESESD